MGGWRQHDEVRLRLWIESAHQCLTSAAADDAARTWTFQSEERFCAILAGQSIGAVPGQGELIQWRVEGSSVPTICGMSRWKMP